MQRGEAAQMSPRVPRARIVELDGLRGIAILLVLVFHFTALTGPLAIFQVAFGIGWIGVDLFFVLSGFLITGILVDSVDGPAYYRNFVVRRSLRIFPAYYIALLLACVLAYWPGKILWKDFFNHEGGGWFAVYLGNFYVLRLKNAWPHNAFLTPLWSLQVEEQFYLTYPLLVAIFRRGSLKKVLLAMIVIALLFRTAVTLAWPDNLVAAYILMPSRMDALAMGGLVALAMREHAAWLHDRRVAWVTAVCTLAFATLWWKVGSTSWPTPTRMFGYTLIDAAFTGILILLVVWKQPWLVRVCRNRVLAWIGTISYGVYLLHMQAGDLMRKYIEPKIGVAPYSSAETLLVIAASITLAFVSWTFIEEPILRLRDRLTARTEAEPLHR